MQIEPVISYRNIEPSDSVTTLVKRRIAVLERLHDRLTGCEVTLEAPQKKKVHGRVYKARLTLHIPGPDFHAESASAQGSARTDLLMAVNRAFAAAEKHLKRQKKKMGLVEVKHHPPVLHGEVTALESELGYGYLRADDGREVYFQRDGFDPDIWDAVTKGARLRFRVQEGEKGPYAIGVSMMD